jgi:RNA binding exosome subunit
MEKLAHSLYAEAFEYPTEDHGRVIAALSLVLPKGAAVKADKIASFYGPEIKKLSWLTTKQPEIKQVVKNVLGSLSDKDRKEVIDTIEGRLDHDDGCLYLRFNKQEAAQGRLSLGYKGDTVKVVIKFAVFPYSAEKAELAARKLFS